MRRDLLSPSMAEMELSHLKNYTTDAESKKHIDVMCHSFNSKVKDLFYSGWINSKDDYRLGNSEKDSWLPSHRSLANLLERANLKKSLVLIQYFFPMMEDDALPSRADAVLCGRSKNGDPNVLGMEIKNWSRGTFLFHRCKNNDEIELQYRSSGASIFRKKPHLEAEDYEERLKEIVKGEPELKAEAIAYLPNITADTKWTRLIHSSSIEDDSQPSNLFCGYNDDDLIEKLKEKFSGGDGRGVASLLKTTRAKFLQMKFNI